jgi:transketolase
MLRFGFQMRNKLIELIAARATHDPNVLFLTGDLGFSVVEPLQKTMGPKFINAGVAEANMMSMASTLAACGFSPYVFTIAPFITARCYEQVRLDVCYHRRRVVLIGIGAGFSYGSLGNSHHSLEDATIMATLPNMIVASPSNKNELAMVHDLLVTADCAAYLRVPRESGGDFSVPSVKEIAAAAYTLRNGDDVALVASGPSVNECLAAAAILDQQGISASVVSVPVIHPFPVERAAAAIGQRPVISVFEGYVGGPIELGLLRWLASEGGSRPHRHLAVALAYPERCATTEGLRADFGIDRSSIVAAAIDVLGGGTWGIERP